MSFDSCTPVELITDGTPITYGVVQPGPEDADGVLFIRGGDISGGRINTANLRTISRELSHQYKRTLLKGGELVISLVGNPGEVAIVPNALKGANIARQVGLVRVDKNRFHPKFVQYYLMSPAGKAQLFSYSLGSVQSVINLKELKRVEIPNFPLETQEKIVKCLGEIDEKIDLNRRINQTLEAMAQAIFKSWFVDFDPVKAKISAIEQDEDPLRAAMRAISGKTDAELDQMPREHHDQLAATAALFPDAMEESELGEIPRGWKVGSLSNLASFQNGYAFKTKDWTNSGYPVIKIGNVKPGIIDLSGCSFVAHETVADLERFSLKRGDLLVGMTGYVGETGLIPALDSVAYLNQRVGRIYTSSRINDVGYPFCLVRDPRYKAYAESKAHGSAQANVSGKDLMDYAVVLPNAEILNIFNVKAARFINSLLSYHEESQSLASLRDTLLPKLLSGELSVADVEVPA